MVNSIEQSPRVPESPTYSSLLSNYLLVNPQEPLQSPEISMRAARIIINSVGKYPQAGRAADLIADRLMRGFGPDSRIARGIGIPEMAYMIPDAEACAEAINKFHKGFEIPVVVTPSQAGDTVTRFAGFALNEIHKFTLTEAQRQRILTPPEIIGEEVMNLTDKIKGPWSFNRPLCLALNDFLIATPQVLESVAARVHGFAEKVRSMREKQQRYAQEKGRKLLATT